MNNNKKLPAQAAPKNEPFFCFKQQFQIDEYERRKNGRKKVYNIEIRVINSSSTLSLDDFSVSSSLYSTNFMCPFYNFFFFFFGFVIIII